MNQQQDDDWGFFKYIIQAAILIGIVALLMKTGVLK